MFAFPTDNAGRTRLLPASIPFRYFVAAAGFDLAGWLLLLSPELAPASFAGGLGPALAALHAMTLGVLTMTVVGASMQLLPVATVQSVRAPRLARALWWLLVPSVAVLVAAMAVRAVSVALWAGVVVASVLALYAGLLAALLAGARRQRAMTWHGWIALGCLVGVAITGPLLLAQQHDGWLDDPRGVALAHLVLAGYGFAGLLATGFSYLLVPMFVVSKGPVEQVQRRLLAGLGTAVVSASALLLADAPRIWVGVLAAAGLIPAGVHVGLLLRALARRRSSEGPWTRILMRAAWVGLLTSVGLAAALAAGLAAPGAGSVLVTLLVPGWLISFVLAMLLRIVPFLASVHAKLAGGPVFTVGDLAPAPLAWLVVLGHLTGVAALLIGLLAEQSWLISVAALAGAAGALGLLGFQAVVLARTRLIR